MTAQRNVLVAGDVTMAWNVAVIHRAPDDGLTWNLKDEAEIHGEAGGAVLIANLLSCVFAGYQPSGVPVNVYSLDRFVEPDSQEAEGYHHSYAVWSEHDRTRVERPGAKKVWRMDQFLGFHGEKDSAERRDRIQGDEAPTPDLIVLADTNLSFRDLEERWPDEIKTTAPDAARPWVFVKAGAPLLGGPLWRRLLARDPERLVVLTTLSELRLSGIRPKRILSWEGLSAEVVDQVLRHPRLHELAACAFVVISIGTGGAIILSRAPAKQAGSWEPTPKCTMIFDPNAIANSWVEDYPGRMIGYASCVTAGVARELLGDVTEREIIRGVRRGLMAARVLHLEGLTPTPRVVPAKAGVVKLRFPEEAVAREVNRDPEIRDDGRPEEAWVELPSVRISRDPSWTILQSTYPDDTGPVAETVARLGVETALKGVPVGRFGDLVTVDRGEIEGLRGLRDTLREHKDRPSKRPFCFSVFGPPGAGKSFAVESVARATLEKDSFEWLRFNLSQMQGRAELVDALHRVRDCGLRGKIPFVFWDEFDSDLEGQELGWLQHFLAPMQDGVFFERQIEHPLGNAIFAFAGGKNVTRRQFDRGRDPVEAVRQKFIGVKGPDFVSRLKGNVDIVGINPRRSGNPAETDRFELEPAFPEATDPSDEDVMEALNKAAAEAAQVDPFYRIRRAILLRAVLLKDWPNLFEIADERGTKKLNIDGRVLRAFIRTHDYKYGARSLESIVAMSTLSAKASFDRAAMPDGEQLRTHVSMDFLEQATHYMPQGVVLEDLARAVHKCRAGELAPHTPERYLAGHMLVPPLRGVDREDGTPPEGTDYDALDIKFKEQNLAYAQIVPRKAFRLGYWIQRPTDGQAVPKTLDLEDAEVAAKVEEFAKFEHDHWYLGRSKSGWQEGPRLDQYRMKHPHMKPWDELGNPEKDKDRKLALVLCQLVSDANLVLVEPLEGAVASEGATG